MDNIKFSYYTKNKVSLLYLLFPDGIKQAAHVTKLIRNQRTHELMRLDTKVDREITKDQLNEELDRLQLQDYKL